MVKRITAAILSGVTVVTMLAACGTNRTSQTSEKTESVSTPEITHPKDNGNLHTLFFKDCEKSGKVTATFLNSLSGASEDVEMVKCAEDDDSYTFSCEGDVNKYNVAYFRYDGKKTSELAFNRCVSGWYSDKKGLRPYTQGLDTDRVPKFEPVTLDCNGYEKKIYIWTPEGYDPSSDEKYAAIYVLDGDDEVNTQDPEARPDDCLYIPEQIESMMATTGYKAIFVGVSTYGDMNEYMRDDELVPDIGEVSEEGFGNLTKKIGGDFARFMAETLVPYVQQHYNVYTDALHTSVTGVSLGGLESFYITMEYPEIFGTAGVLSPSFWTYDDSVWRKYLGEKDFNKNTPFIYLYTGPEGGDTDPYVTEMYNRMKEMGYPADKIALCFNEMGGHHSKSWRNNFSGYLSAMVFQSVEPLQKQ